MQCAIGLCVKKGISPDIPPPLSLSLTVHFASHGRLTSHISTTSPDPALGRPLKIGCSGITTEDKDGLPLPLPFSEAELCTIWAVSFRTATCFGEGESVKGPGCGVFRLGLNVDSE